MASFTLEETEFINATRAKVLRQEATREELHKAFAILRQGRVAASTGATASRSAKAAAKAPVDTSAVLANLRSLGQNLKSTPQEG